ncbi:MAG: pilus assembly protein PilM [Eubacteriales bacterium]|nr:pilus assembly protein PilM [Eubacteriales bacterium]
MAKKILGIEIGNCNIKMAVWLKGSLEQIVVEPIPDGLVERDEIVSRDAMSEFIKNTIAKNKIACKNVAIVLPERLVYTKRVFMHAMTVNQLKVNLPYEFQEYITEDKEDYIYDYELIEKKYDSQDNFIGMELIITAAPKDLIESYRTMLRRSGLKLTVIAPEFDALNRIIKDHEALIGEKGEKDYVILDIGHTGIKLFFFLKGRYDITRVMGEGCEAIDAAIASFKRVGLEAARAMKETNEDNVLFEEQCMEIYGRMAIEVMRVLNFYNYNHLNNNIETLYYCGGGSLIEPLIDAIAQSVEVKIEGIEALCADDYEDRNKIRMGIKALGITWE